MPRAKVNKPVHKGRRRRPVRADSSKPPFRVPTMREIRRAPRNGLKVVSTFSGAGGSCLGYRMAGYHVVWANEFTEASAFLYLANADPGTILDRRDVRKIKPEEILEATGLEVGELDLLDGSPPCDSFSMVGKRDKGWGKEKRYSGGIKQRTDDLFGEYIRLVDGLRPRAFVAENVKGLVIGKAKGYFKEIMAGLKGCGYRVSARVLKSQWLGVPQKRQRVIFIGVREDQPFEPVFPDPLPYRYSVQDALPWIKSAWHDTGTPSWSAGQFADEPSPTITVGVNAINSCHYLVLEWRPLTKAELKRMPAHREILGKKGSRKFSIAEAKRLFTFPDDFKMDGPYKNSWRALGMSVPPFMMRAVAERMRSRLLEGPNGPA